MLQIIRVAPRQRPAPPPASFAFYRRALAVLALLGLAAGNAQAQGDSSGVNAELNAVTKDLRTGQEQSDKLAREAEKLKRDLTELRARSIAAARRAQDLESELSQVEITLAVLQTEETRKDQALQTSRAQLAAILAALQRIALQPQEALALNPGDPLDTVRSAMLLSVIVPDLEAKAEVLRKNLEALARLREEISGQRLELAAATTRLKDQQSQLETLLTEKQHLSQSNKSDRIKAGIRLSKLANRAEDLKDLIGKLAEEARRQRAHEAAEKVAREAQQAAAARKAQQAARQQEAERQARAALAAEPGQRDTPTPAGPRPQAAPDRNSPQQSAALTILPLEKPKEIRAFPKSPGGLLQPARGRVLERYGQASKRAISGTSRGLLIQTRGGAQVISPYDGKVVYAGEFRGYGLILIIEHDQRYHSLIAGLDRLYVGVDQWILAGEPIGVMGAGNRLPELYLELRRSGQPIDPLPWLASNENKAQG